MVLTANVIRGLTGGIDANSISFGTLSNARLPPEINANFSGNGALLTSLSASNISSGIIDNARLPPTITATQFIGSGAGLSNLNGANVSGVIDADLVWMAGTIDGSLTIADRLTANTVVVSNGSASAPSVTFAGNTTIGFYSNSNLVTSSTNVQVPSGIVTAMNTTTSVTGSMPAYINALGCSWHSGSAAGVSTGIVTPLIGGFAATDVVALYKNPPALYDFFRTYVNLAAGTYTFRLHACRGNDRAIVTVVVGSTTIGTIDLYTGSVPTDAISDLTSISIPSTGLYKVELQINSKNASSSNYYFIWRAAAFIRTA